VAMLALAVNGDKNAQRWVNPAQPDKGRALAVELLHRKVNSYALFRRAYPGYGHFLPWFTVNQTTHRITPDNGWYGRVPALDNGELAWSAVAAWAVLSAQGTLSSQLIVIHKMIERARYLTHIQSNLIHRSDSI